MGESDKPRVIYINGDLTIHFVCVCGEPYEDWIDDILSLTMYCGKCKRSYRLLFMEVE